MAKQILVRRRARILQPVASRPHLVAAILFGILFFFLSQLWDIRIITRVVIGWDGGVLVFLALAIQFMRGADHDCMKRRAIAHDEGRHLMLLLTMMFCVSYLISDVLYAVLNPRIRINGGER